MRVAALSPSQEMVASDDSFQRYFAAALEKSGHPDLVVLPGLIGVAWTLAQGSTLERGSSARSRRETRHPSSVYPSSLPVDDDANRRMYELHSRLAKRHGVWIVGGSTIERHGHHAFIVSSVWRSDGSCCGAQQQTHLSRAERSVVIRDAAAREGAPPLSPARGTELALFEIDGTRLGVIVGTDLWHPEVGRILALQGADIIAGVGALPSGGRELLRIAGLWSQVQQNQVWGVESFLAGSLGGEVCEGAGAVLGPCEATAGSTGYLAFSSRPSVREPSTGAGSGRSAPGILAAATLDETRREAVLRSYPLLDHLNPDAYRGRLPELYPERRPEDGRNEHDARRSCIGTVGEHSEPERSPAGTGHEQPAETSGTPVLFGSLKERLFRRYLFWSARGSRIRGALSRARAPGPEPQATTHAGPAAGARRAAGAADTAGSAGAGDTSGAGGAVRSGGGAAPATRAGGVGRGKQTTYTVAAVQLQAQLFRDPTKYAAEMHRFVYAAQARGARLIVFPENNNLQLLGMLPGIEKMAERAAENSGPAADSGPGANTQGAGVETAERAERSAASEEPGGARYAGGPSGDAGSPEPTVADVIRYVGPVTRRIVARTFSWLAKRYRCYIMAGSFLLPTVEGVVNRALLFGPGGELIACHDKTHLMPVEASWGIRRGTGFDVVATELGAVALPVCMDATYFESFRIVELLGARIVMLPIANPEPYNYWTALRGIQLRVQESPVYGIKSALVGDLLGFRFTGRAGIFAPLELTPRNTEALVELEHAEREGIAYAELNMNALEELRAGHPRLDFNRQLYARYFPEAYHRRP